MSDILNRIFNLFKHYLWVQTVYKPFFTQNQELYSFLLKDQVQKFLNPETGKMPDSFLEYLSRKNIIAIVDFYDFIKVKDIHLGVPYYSHLEFIILLSNQFDLNSYQQVVNLNNKLKNLFIGFLQIRHVQVNAKLISSSFDIDENKIKIRLALCPLGMREIESLNQCFIAYLDDYFDSEINQKYRRIELEKKSKLNRIRPRH